MGLGEDMSPHAAGQQNLAGGDHAGVGGDAPHATVTDYQTCHPGILVYRRAERAGAFRQGNGHVQRVDLTVGGNEEGRPHIFDLDPRPFLGQFLTAQQMGRNI